MSLRHHTSEKTVGMFNWRKYILGEISLLHYTKDNKLATLRKRNNCFYWLLSGLHIAMTIEVALKLSKKYESVRLYLHWPNVPTLTLSAAIKEESIIWRRARFGKFTDPLPLLFHCE